MLYTLIGMMTVDNQGVLNKPVASSFIAPVVCCIGDGLPMLPSCGCLSAGCLPLCSWLP